MAELLHLDAAAKLVGKSEVTLRRLVKAGKIAVEKEKTTTGFVYLVDADEVQRYYGVRRSAQTTPKTESKHDPEVPHAVESQGRVRVAVSGDQGSTMDYWLKRAETYEERYYKEVQKTGELREELGLWRGRAEHAQGLLIKLLPAPNTVEVNTPQATPVQQTVTKKTRRLTTAGVLVLVALPVLIVLGGVLVYLIRTAN